MILAREGARTETLVSDKIQSEVIWGADICSDVRTEDPQWKIWSMLETIRKDMADIHNRQAKV